MWGSSGLLSQKRHQDALCARRRLASDDTSCAGGVFRLQLVAGTATIDAKSQLEDRTEKPVLIMSTTHGLVREPDTFLRRLPSVGSDRAPIRFLGQCPIGTERIAN